MQAGQTSRVRLRARVRFMRRAWREGGGGRTNSGRRPEEAEQHAKQSISRGAPLATSGHRRRYRLNDEVTATDGGSGRAAGADSSPQDTEG